MIENIGEDGPDMSAYEMADSQAALASALTNNQARFDDALAVRVANERGPEPQTVGSSATKAAHDNWHAAERKRVTTPNEEATKKKEEKK